MILRFHYQLYYGQGQKIESLIPTGSFLPLAGGTMTGAIISKDIIVPSGNVITLTECASIRNICGK